MIAFTQAFVSGLQRSLQWRLWLPLYLTSLLIGLAQSWPVWFFGASPYMESIATGEFDALVNLLIGNRPAQVSALAGAAIWLGLSLGLTLLSNLAYNFFSGGILSVWQGTRHFWPGCRRFFGAFVGLAIVIGLLLGLLIPPCLGLLALWPIVGLVLVILLITLISLWGEYARAITVVREQPNIFKSLGLALQVWRRHFLGVMALGLLGLVLHGVILQLYLSLSAALKGSVSVVVLQQLVILFWLWLKLLRLGWALSYVQATEPAPTGQGNPET